MTYDPGTDEHRAGRPSLPIKSPLWECPQCGESSETDGGCGCYEDDFGDEWDCTHCGGEGTCDDGADPLWDCPDEAHACHACGGSGKRSDQRIF